MNGFRFVVGNLPRSEWQLKVPAKESSYSFKEKLGNFEGIYTLIIRNTRKEGDKCIILKLFL